MSRRLLVFNLGTSLLVASITAGHASGQTPYTLITSTASQDEKHPIIYVNHLEPPYYPPLARQTRVHGTVAMKLKIGVDGRVLGIESEPKDTPKAAFAMLKDHAEKSIKTWTFGCVGCSPDAPFEHIIKFAYVLDNNLPERTSSVT